MKPALALLATVAGLALLSGSCLACSLDLVNTSDSVRDRIFELDNDNTVRLFEVQFRLPETDEIYLKKIANGTWIRPMQWFLTYGRNSERALLLFNDYSNGLFTLQLTGTLSQEEVEVEVRPSGCFQGMEPEEAEDVFRMFILSGFTSPETGNASDPVEPYRSGLTVCSMHINCDDDENFISYQCCKAIQDGLSYECRTMENQLAVRVLYRLFRVLLWLLLYFFPLLLPRGYEFNTFSFVPKKTREMNVVVTGQPQNYSDLGCSTIHIRLLEKVRSLHEQLTHMEPDKMYRLKVAAIKVSTDMDRLLPEKKPPFGLVKLLDTFVQFWWRSAPMRAFCQTPLCGECCRCCCSVPWQNFVLAMRTLLVMLVLALPALSVYYKDFLDDSDHSQIIEVCRNSQDFSERWISSTQGKVLVGIWACFYLLSFLAYLRLSYTSNFPTYSEVLRFSTKDVSLKSWLQMLKKMVLRTLVPLRKYGLLFLPLWLLLLALTVVLLLLYIFFTSPWWKMCFFIIHQTSFRYIKRTTWQAGLMELVFMSLLPFVLFVICDGFLSVLSIIWVIVINFIINFNSALQIVPVVLLFVVYTRDTFKRLVDRYTEFHRAILTKVISLGSEGVRPVASQAAVKRKNTALVIKSPEVLPPSDPPSDSASDSASDPALDLPLSVIVDVKAKCASLCSYCVRVVLGQPFEPEMPDTAPIVFRYGALKARMRSLVLFLDKDNVPYISQKFFLALTQMTCPGSPGDLSEAVTQAILNLVGIVIFLLLLLVFILAFGDAQSISSGVQFLATMSTGLLPLILSYVVKEETTLDLDTENLRFQTQFPAILNGFTQTWDLTDLAIEEVKNKGSIKRVGTVSIAKKDSASSSSKENQSASQNNPNGAQLSEAVMKAVDDRGNTVDIPTSDVIEAVESATSTGVVADSSSAAAQRNTVLVTGLYKVDGVLMQALQELSPFGDEPEGSEEDLQGRAGNKLQVDLVVDISDPPSVTLPRVENKFHYLVHLPQESATPYHERSPLLHSRVY